MTKYVSIDPGKCKCGFVYADTNLNKVLKAIVLQSELLIQKVIEFKKRDKELKVLIGNGTTSKTYIELLGFLGSDLFIVDEKNTTFRSKQRYFEIFPLKGIKRILPKEIFLKNINLDAISALIILEDYLKYKFDVNSEIESKTWLQ